jgi:hypothetical protein
MKGNASANPSEMLLDLLISRVKTDHTESPEVHRVRATTSPTCVCFVLPMCIATGASVPESAAMRNKSCGSRWFSRGQDPEGVLIVVAAHVACCRQFAVVWGRCAWYGDDRLLATLIQMISAMNIYVVIFTSMILCNVLGNPCVCHPTMDSAGYIETSVITRM